MPIQISESLSLGMRSVCALCAVHEAFRNVRFRILARQPTPVCPAARQSHSPSSSSLIVVACIRGVVLLLRERGDGWQIQDQDMPLRHKKRADRVFREVVVVVNIVVSCQKQNIQAVGREHISSHTSYQIYIV